jgi:hypothetical protein
MKHTPKGSIMTNIIHKLAVVSALTLAGAVHAASAPVDWNYTFDLQWVTGKDAAGNNITTFSTPDVAGDRGRKYVDSTLISWGATSGSDWVHSTRPEFSRSSILINQPHVTSSTPIVTNDGVVKANAFSHDNRIISGSFDSLKSTQLQLDITLNPADYGFSGTSFSWTKTFEVSFKETPNTTKDPWLDGDVFALTWEGTYSEQFTLDGYIYTFNYFDANLNLNPLATSACSAIGKTNCVGFVTAEGYITPVQFGFNVSAVPIPVPEPETYAMLLVGLGIVGAVAARRRRGYI